MRRERIRRAVASVRYFLRIPRRNGPLRLENMQQPQALIQLNPTPPATAGGGASNNAQQAAEQDDILDEITADKAVDSTDSGQALNQSTTNANASTGLDEGQAPPSNADPVSFQRCSSHLCERHVRSPGKFR